jgi:hypothetical protein
VTSARMAGILLIAGSVIFLAGAAIGVPGVFTESDPQQLLRMLTAHLTMWRIAQPLYGLGPIVAAVGAGYLTAAAQGRGTRALFGASCVALAIGALAWTCSLYLRGTRVAEFAHGSLPSWPFVTYVLLTIGGLALLGLGLLAGGFPTWLGWLILGADVLFLVGYLWLKDIPPFVFYLLLLLTGVVLF